MPARRPPSLERPTVDGDDAPPGAEEIYGHIGRALRTTRRARGWSQHQVARASGGWLKASTLGAYERGDRGVPVAALYRIADLYDVSVSALLPPQATAGDSAAEVSSLIGYLPPTDHELLRVMAERMLRGRSAAVSASAITSTDLADRLIG